MKNANRLGESSGLLKLNGLAFVASLSLCITPLIQAQTTVDFNGYPLGTPITNQYAAQGISFATQDANNVLGTAAIISTGAGVSNSATGFYPTTEFLNLNLAQPAHVVSFYFNDENDNGISYYNIYNASHTLIQTGPLNDVNGETVTLNLTGVSEIQMSNGNTTVGDNWIFDIDSITLFLSPNVFSPAGLTTNQKSALTPINQGVNSGSANPNFTALVAGLTPGSGSPTALGSVLDSYSPQKLQVFGNVAFDNFGFTATQLDNHLASLRYGQGGFDTSGLQVLDSSMPTELSQIKSRLLAFNPAPVSSGVSDVGGPALGVVKTTDPKDMEGVSVPEASQNRWSAFISGNVILANLNSTSDLAYSHYTTGAVVAGADYRISKNWAVGAMFGYGHTSLTLDNVGSTARVDSYSPGIYATYVDHGWYANGLFAYDYNSYGETRAIPALAGSANGSTAGNQYGANLDGGYEFHRGNLTFGPTAALQYVHLDINSFTESGPGALDINNENANSLRSRLGAQMRYNWLWYGGKVTATPYVSASWQHEYLDDSRGITSQFDGAGLGSFTVDTTSPERDSALISAGFNTQWNSALNLFVDYTVQVGQSDFFAQSIEGGAKVSF
ncbi:MAG: autotransporter outer membrane beta-barrel domain-containing protein [Methylacidiphilales bacterium]|nr:autotransporter outer membrane beta-barrel domain-containing protein [Candidatus Methylacidiphilales bacterium]